MLAFLINKLKFVTLVVKYFCGVSHQYCEFWGLSYQVALGTFSIFIGLKFLRIGFFFSLALLMMKAYNMGEYLSILTSFKDFVMGVCGYLSRSIAHQNLKRRKSFGQTRVELRMAAFDAAKMKYISESHRKRKWRIPVGRKREEVAQMMQHVSTWNVYDIGLYGIQPNVWH